MTLAAMPKRASWTSLCHFHLTNNTIDIARLRATAPLACRNVTVEPDTLPSTLSVLFDAA